MASPVSEGPGYSRRRVGGYRRIDRVVTRDPTVAARLIAALAAAVAIVLGLLALARIRWEAGGLDAAAVEVAEITFTPVVAIAAGVAGLFALLAAATRDRTSKIVVGVLLVCVGVVAFVARPDSSRIILEAAHGWLMVLVGGVLIIAALAMSWSSSRRLVDTDAIYE